MSDQASSNDTSSSAAEQLKAGHPPATKVGGMRVSAPRPRHASHGEDKDAKENAEEAQESAGENVAADGTGEENAANEEPSSTVANRSAGDMVSGVFVPVEKAYPTEAVKHIHDKPGMHPKNEFHAHVKHTEQKFINQPRKQ